MGVELFVSRFWLHYEMNDASTLAVEYYDLNWDLCFFIGAWQSYVINI